MICRDVTIRLGDVFLRLTGEVPIIPEDSYLARFRTEETRIDVLCRIEQKDELKPPEGECVFRSPMRQVVRTEDALCVAHFSVSSESPSAILTVFDKEPDVLELALRGGDSECLHQRILNSIAMEHLLLRHGHAIFHAAWFERQGSAVLFSGDSGAGKSTHTNLWARERSVYAVNGDRALFLRRNETIFAAGLPYAGSSGICENRILPVRTVVFLSHGKENDLRRLPPGEAVRALVSQMPVQKWCADDLSSAMQMALTVAERVPIYAYACLPNSSSVDFLEQALFSKEKP